MLGARTKQVNAYGRRGHRIINVSENHEISKTLSRKEPAKRKPVAESTPDYDDDAGSTSSLSPSPKAIQKRRVRRPIPTVVSPESTPEPAEKVAPPRAVAKRAKKSPKTAKSAGIEAKMPGRHPLSVIHTNTPASSAMIPDARKKRKPRLMGASPFAPPSPFIDVDIVILDAQGRRISQERRVSRTDVQANPLGDLAVKATRKSIGKRLDGTRKTTHDTSSTQVVPRVAAAALSKEKAKKSPETITISDSDDETPLPARPKSPRKKARHIIISDDESDDDIVDLTMKIPPLELSLPSPKQRNTRERVLPAQRSIKDISPFLDGPPIPHATPRAPWLPSSSLNTRAFLSPELSRPGKSQPRPLTPLRARLGRPTLFPAPPSPPSPTTPTDFDDLTFDLSNLDLSPSAVEKDVHGSVPAYLAPLLEECEQSMPHEFSAFIDMFPFDPMVRTAEQGPAHFQKIGEASYSEVFGIGDVVLKVIPLRNEEMPQKNLHTADEDVDSPAPSDAKDVLKEMIVTRAMGEMCEGFVKLLRTYIVRGKYPSLLLDLWDEYNENKGSESVRPDSFTVSQVYAIIVLPNGGPDLEAYSFSSPSKFGWRQACSLFWQVTRTLAEAEDLVCFEHRDLHWGQILVKNVAVPSRLPSGSSRKKVSMDHIAHGVQATIIDLGLSRMNSDDDDETQVHWTPIDEDVFEGEGDYQFDIYRMMKKHSKGAWKDYRPLSNVMWLHYLASKLLLSKRLRPPPISTKSEVQSTSIFTEQECYQCLVELEAVLGQSVAPLRTPAPAKGRRKAQAPRKAAVLASGALQTAADVLQVAVERGWVQ